MRATEVVDNPYGLEALWRGGDIVARFTLGILVVMSMGSWYIIITKVYEQYKMNKHARQAEKTFWSAPSVVKGAEGLKKNSPFRYIAETGIEAIAQAHRPAREGRHERMDHDVDPARDRQRAEPHAGWPRVPRHRRLDRAVRRAVRHGVGHLPRADGDRHRRPGLDRQGRGSGGRGADHDRLRPCGRGARRAGLQLARAPQQVGARQRARLRRRPARRPPFRAEAGQCGAEPCP